MVAGRRGMRVKIEMKLEIPFQASAIRPGPSAFHFLSRNRIRLVKSEVH